MRGHAVHGLLVVLGVLERKGQSGSGQDQDDAILLPWTTAQKKIRGRNQTWLDDIIGSAVAMVTSRPFTSTGRMLRRCAYSDDIT